MVPELEKPRVTELQLRMDCNGCVQKIKKALHNVDGVYDIYIDTAQQKLTVVGRAELDKILKAIKKTKKIPTICSHTDPKSLHLSNRQLTVSHRQPLRLPLTHHRPKPLHRNQRSLQRIHQHRIRKARLQKQSHPKRQRMPPHLNNQRLWRRCA